MKIEHFLTFLTIIVGILVVSIAYRQFVLSKEKFKLDLFAKRFAIYKGAQSFLTFIMNEGKVTIEKIYQFRAETQDAIFLFDDDIAAILKQIDEKALNLWATTEKSKKELDCKEKSILNRDGSELFEWLISQLPKLKDIFSPYLKFKTWK